LSDEILVDGAAVQRPGMEKQNGVNPSGQIGAKKKEKHTDIL
jgi:hypothetical protein